LPNTGISNFAKKNVLFFADLTLKGVLFCIIGKGVFNFLKKARFYYTALATSLLLGFFLHLWVGYTLPLPVGDEVVFYYPALAFGRNLHFDSMHLNADRALFWMPTGYMALLGGWLRWVSEGLESARWFSFIVSALAYLMCQAWVRGMRLGWVGFATMAFAFLGRHWVLVGNFVRMEGLLLFLIATGLVLIVRKQPLAALCFFVIGLSVHPNALYFIMAWPLLAFLARGKFDFGMTTLLSFGLLFITTGLYGLYALANWKYFVSDWAFQLSTREAEGWKILILRPDQFVFLAGIAGAAWIARGALGTRGIRIALVAAFTFWVMRVLGQGWSYGVFSIICISITLAVWLKLARRWAALHKREMLFGYLPTQWLPWRSVAFGVGLFLGSAVLVLGKAYSLPFYAPTYQWLGMGPENADKPYFTTTDKEIVLAHLAKHLPTDSLTRLYILPEGDGMILGEREADHWLHVLPVFGSQLPSYMLVHTSASAEFARPAYEEFLAAVGRQTLEPFYSRQGTEHWYLVNISGRLPAFIKDKKDAPKP